MVKTNKKRKGVQVTYKTLNNKSRKGEYAYVKEYGKRGSYYKVQPSIGKRDKSYKDIYKAGGFHSRKGVTGQKVKQVRSAIKKLKSFPNIEQSFRAGYSQATIESAHKLTPYSIKLAYQNLLKNKDKKGDGKSIVRDKELLSILTLPENVAKWKHRMMYKINIIDQTDEVLATITPETIKTLNDIQKEVIGKIIIGQEFSAMYKDLGETVKKNGYKMESSKTTTGRVTKVKIVMAFKKGM